MSSALSTLNTTTEVPLSKALLPGCRSINVCPLLWVCVHGVCVFTAVCALGWMQSTNSEYESPYLVVCGHVNFTFYCYCKWKEIIDLNPPPRSKILFHPKLVCCCVLLYWGTLIILFNRLLKVIKNSFSDWYWCTVVKKETKNAHREADEENSECLQLFSISGEEWICCQGCAKWTQFECFCHDGDSFGKYACTHIEAPRCTSFSR